MADFVQLGEERIREREYNESVQTASDVDSFVQMSVLPFDDARKQIDDVFSTEPKSIVLFGPKSPVSMVLGNTIQLTVQLFRGYFYSPAISPDTFGKDVTVDAEWLTDPELTDIVTVVNGLVTATDIGVVYVYAKVGDLISNKILIFVQSDECC